MFLARRFNWTQSKVLDRNSYVFIDNQPCQDLFILWLLARMLSKASLHKGYLCGAWFQLNFVVDSTALIIPCIVQHTHWLHSRHVHLYSLTYWSCCGTVLAGEGSVCGWLWGRVPHWQCQGVAQVSGLHDRDEGTAGDHQLQWARSRPFEC